MVVAHLAERSLTKPEIRTSNLVIDKFYTSTVLKLYQEDPNKKKKWRIIVENNENKQKRQGCYIFEGTTTIASLTFKATRQWRRTWSHPRPLICLFLVFFKQTTQNLQQINVKNWPGLPGFELTTFWLWVYSFNH